MSMVLVYALLVVLGIADRVTKQMALMYENPCMVNDILSFELVFNRGVSWSLFHSDDTLFFGLVTIGVALIALSLTYYTYIRYKEGHTIVGELLTLMGAYSNIVDRCLYQGVIDFIVLSVGTWTFPVFNIADVAIIGGVIIMLLTHMRDI